MKLAAAHTADAWYAQSRGPGSPAALRLAVLLALALHVPLLLVGFEMLDASGMKRSAQPLEVIVLRRPAPTDERPEEADALAQVDRVGGGSEAAADPIEPSPVEPLPAEPEAAEIPPPAPEPPAPAAPIEAPAPPPLLSARIEEPRPVPAVPEPQPEVPPPVEAPPPAPTISAAEILASRSLEIARLTARLDQSGTGQARRLKRKAVSASTREYKYANYLEGWRRKVERIGNLNYPAEAKERRLYGSLILHVAVRADGTLEEVRVLRSSGIDVLDDAAVRIVELAAPFAPFPPDIKQETDVLDITRTWQFLSSNRLGWEN